MTSPTPSRKLRFSAHTEHELAELAIRHNARISDQDRQVSLAHVMRVFASSAARTRGDQITAMSNVREYLRDVRQGAVSPGEAPDNTIQLPNEFDCQTAEHAIFRLSEFSGLGYESIPAFRAAWLRALRDGDRPFERTALLASALYDSPDSDLLERKPA